MSESKHKSGSRQNKILIIVWGLAIPFSILALMTLIGGMTAEEVDNLAHITVTLFVGVICSFVFLILGTYVGRRQERNYSDSLRGSEARRELSAPPPVYYNMPQVPVQPPASYDYARPLSQSQGRSSFDIEQSSGPDFSWGDL